MAGPGSIMSIATTLALLLMLSISVIFVLRSLASKDEQAQPQEKDIPQGPREQVRRPGPPASITLAPYTAKKDQFAGNPEALDAHKAMIGKGGMERIGDFVITQMPGYVIRAFTHPERNLLGILYSDPAGKVWMNVQTEYSDGRIITTSSMEKTAASQSRPRGMPIFNYPGIEAEQLLRRHKLETRGVEQAPPLRPEDFMDKFAANYARLQERAEEAQITFEPAEPQQTTDSHRNEEDQAQSWGQPEKPVESRQPSLDQMKAWLDLIFNKVKVPPEKREEFRKGLVWIDETASPEEVIYIINEYGEVTVEPVAGERLVIRSGAGVEDIVDAKGLLGAALFEQINRQLPEQARFTKLPLVADGVAFFSRMTPLY